MATQTNRREEELVRLRALELQTGRRIRVMRMLGEPVKQIDLKLEVWTAEDPNFPGNALSEVYVSIMLGAFYPFVPPRVELQTQVFNPLVDGQGQVHFGQDWSAGCYLDTLVCRLFKILAFDEDALNMREAVNEVANEWYKTAKALIPSAFPSDKVVGIESEPSSAQISPHRNN